MKKHLRYSAVILTTLAMSMTACGIAEEDAAVLTPETQNEIQEITPEPEAAPQLSETEQAILDYELRYSKGEFTMEDYQALAGLYQEQGLIRKQRDMLEESYRLYDDAQAFETLQAISVNLEEEDGNVKEQTSLMLQNLELEEYLGESINLISTDEWFDTMMPKLYEGSRSYFLQRNGETVLLVQAGYDQTGEPFSDVWYLGDTVKVLRHSNNAVQLLISGMEDGVYQGAFESWLCDGNTGDIYHETGTFANGVLTGDYTMAIHDGSEASEVFSLWSNKEGMEYTTYTGNFDEQGVTTLEQPAAKKIASLIKNTDYSTCVVYAYDENNSRNCLFEGVGEDVDTATYTFGIEAMGWKLMPAFETYEVLAENVTGATGTNGATEDADSAGALDGVAISDIKVRIFDGEIQLYLNDAWVGMGSAEQYAKEDPLQAYEDSRLNAGDGANNDGEGTNSQSAFGQNRVEGEIPKDVVKPAAKPAAPAPTPESTPAPAPAPTPEPDDDDHDEPAPAPEPEPTPEPEPEPDNGGNDVDVEWTPDIL